MKKKYRVLFISLAAVLAAVLLISLAWYIHRATIFGDYEKITIDNRFPGVNISSKDNLTFSISKAHYLRFTGNLGISTEDGMHLIIWLSLKREAAFGFMIIAENEMYNFLVDENGKLLHEDIHNENELSAFQANQSESLRLLQYYGQWKIAAEKGDNTFFDATTR